MAEGLLSSHQIRALFITYQHILGVVPTLMSSAKSLRSNNGKSLHCLNLTAMHYMTIVLMLAAQCQI